MEPFTFRPINFAGPLGDIGQNIASGMRQRRLSDALASALPTSGGVTDWNAVATALAKAGFPDEALKATQIGQRNIQNAPSGFRYTQQGLEPIPGGPGDPAYQRSLPDRQHLPAGYQWDPNDPTKLVPIEGGPAAKLSPNTAGSIAMMQTGQQELERPVSDQPNAQTARQILSDPTKWSKSQAAQSYAPEVMSYFGQTDVTNAQAAVKTNVEAALRMMTGAAAPEQEVARYAAMFTPTWNDTKARAEAKLRRLDEFTQKAQALATQGRSSSPQAAPEPVPSAKTELKIGQTYQSKDGRIGTWDGQQFVPVGPAQ